MPSEIAAKPRSARWLALAGAAVVVIAVVVTVSGISSRASHATRLQTRADAQAIPTVVVIAPGSAASGAQSIELPGRIEAFARAPIYARVSGYLKSWKTDIGTPVKAGDLLGDIETPELDQQLLQAQAELASTRANAALAATTAKRWQSLMDKEFVSSQAVEEKAGDLAIKQAAVKASQANLERLLALKGFARIVAPFDGVVTARATDVGALINVGGAPGTELFVVSDVKRLRMYVNLPQNYVAIVKRGAKVKFNVPEYPGRFFSATVQSLSQAISAGSASMLIQLAVDNANAELLPGGYANVKFELPGAVSAVSIPPSALMLGKAGPRVATVGDGDKVVLKSVTIARDYGAVIELASGLAHDDRLIESPPDGLADGDQVRIAASGRSPKSP